MVTTAATPRTRFASLAVRARNIVESGLCPRASAVPDCLLRTEQLAELAAAPARYRRAALSSLDDDTVLDLMVLSRLRDGTPYSLWADTPSGFAEDVLGIRTWARLRAVLDAVVDHPRVAAPVCFGVGGRRQIAPLLALWHVATHRDGDALTVIAAPSAEDGNAIRRELPRLVDLAGLKRRRDPAVFVVVTGTGPDDEFALSGLHTGNLLLIATDAGRLHQVQGAAIDFVVSSPVRLFAVGIPALEPGSWFEDLTLRATTRTVNMAVSDLPPATGEDVGRCGACPDRPPHPKAVHLPDMAWAARQIATFGPDSPNVSTRVHGRFPVGAPVLEGRS